MDMAPLDLGIIVSESLNPEMELPEGALTTELPSIGSASHGSGLCKPCAWFWKPGGCLNGRDCYHCHLCPRQELKARREAKAKQLRQGRQGAPRKGSAASASSDDASPARAAAPLQL